MDIQKAGQRTRPRLGLAPTLIREKELLQGVPFGKSTLWRLVSEGKFPKPTKLSPRVTVWRLTDVEAWLARVGA